MPDEWWAQFEDSREVLGWLEALEGPIRDMEEVVLLAGPEFAAALFGTLEDLPPPEWDALLRIEGGRVCRFFR